MDLAGTLARELGAGKVLGPEAGDRLDDYGRDECDERRYRRRPDCVVFAEERGDVEVVLRLCRERRVPVTPRGAGSGKAGACVPLAGGVVLSTERMQRLVEVDGDDLVAVAEPGVITGSLQEAVEAAGMFYPPDPASLAFSTIGGNVVTNAGGPRAFKYGVTREYVLGLEVVLMGGEVLRVGRRTAKGVTGYDLTAGFVGSEGTLAVVTEVVLKLVPRPPAVRTALAVYPDVDLAGAAVSALLRQGFRPRTLELMDRTCIEATRGKTEYRFPEGAGAAVLFELDGDEDGLDAALERAGGVADSAGAREVLVAKGEPERRALWQARRELSLLLRAGNRCKVGEDICVPRGALGAMIRKVDAIGAATGIRCATFGHAGDGNLHVQFLLDGAEDDPAVRARVEEGLERLFRATVELGGTLSGEHGIGVTKARFLPLEQSAAAIEWQRRIKALWDPDGLLNPGKLFPPRRSGCSEWGVPPAGGGVGHAREARPGVAPATTPSEREGKTMTHGEIVALIEERLAGRQRRVMHIRDYRPAAVALLLRDRGGTSHVPLIVRPSGMRAHSGQIALPGGVRDDCDADFTACALREAEEELGIAQGAVRVLGELDDVPTPTGFVITPVVAELVAPVDYQPSPDEVSAVFEAPLDTFADSSTAEDMGEREHWGIKYRLHAYRFGEHRIWGATARVLEDLHALLR